MTDGWTTTAPDEAGEEPFDDVWVTTTRRRSRVRSVLLGCLAVALVFLGGAWVQRQWGAAGGGGSSAGGALPGGIELPDGIELPEGVELPSGGGLPAGLGGGTGGATAGSAETATTVVGTLVAKRGEVWVVEDLGGVRHRVEVTADATLRREQQVRPRDVEVGVTVDVTGEPAGGGAVDAQAITVR